MAMQLAPAPGDAGYAPPQGHYAPRGGNSGRPVSTYGAMQPQPMPDQRMRSKSFGAGSQQLSRDGRPVLHFGKFTPHSCMILDANRRPCSSSDVHVPSGNPGRAVVCQGGYTSSHTAPGRWLVGGRSNEQERQAWAGAEQLLAKLLDGNVHQRRPAGRWIMTRACVQCLDSLLLGKPCVSKDSRLSLGCNHNTSSHDFRMTI